MRKNENHTKVDQPVTMRVAGPADGPRIERLAALDSQHPPQGDVILAEVSGELRAAVSLESGAAIADPFRPTPDVVALLRERASQVAGPAPTGHGFGFRLVRTA